MSVPDESVPQKIAKLLIGGFDEGQICELLQILPATLKIHVNSPMFQAVLKIERNRGRQRLSESVTDKLHSLEHMAVDAYERGLLSDDPSAYLRAADSVMDRSNHPKKTQQDSHHTFTIHIDRDDREAIEIACEEAGAPLPTPVLPPPLGVKHISDVLSTPDE